MNTSIETKEPEKHVLYKNIESLKHANKVKLSRCRYMDVNTVTYEEIDVDMDVHEGIGIEIDEDIDANMGIDTDTDTINTEIHT